MPSAYLQSTDYAAFGVPNATAPQVTQASVLIDAYLNRPAGLAYTPDATGQPCYMTALNPTLTLNATAGFSPGASVIVPVSGATQMLQVGDCVVLDAANAALVEAVQVMAVSANSLTLGSTTSPQGVVNSHASGCTIDLGRLLTEKRYLPKQRSEVMLSQTPVGRVVGGTGRYGYGRRGDAASYDMDTFNLLASLNKFGGPPAWEIWPANVAAGIDAATGQLWVPAGVMLAYYTEVIVRYVAGFQYANLPAGVKLACAQLITALANDPGVGNYSSVAAGDTKLERFAATNLSEDVKAMLQPWRARAFA